MARKKLTPMGEWAIAPNSFRARDRPGVKLLLALDGVVVRDGLGRELAQFGQTRAYFAAYDLLKPAIETEALRWAKRVMMEQQMRLGELEKLVVERGDALHDAAKKVIEQEPKSYSKSPLVKKKGESSSEMTARSQRISMARALHVGDEPLLNHLFAHPQGVRIIRTLAWRRDDGVKMAREHIAASRAATNRFRDTLDARKIWRFPPALVAGTAQLKIADIEGVPEFAVALGMLIGRSDWDRALNHAGNAVMAIELAGGPVGVAVAEILDVVLAGLQWLVDFFEAADSDAAALATDFAPTDERLGEHMSALGQMASLMGSVAWAAALPAAGRKFTAGLPSKVPDLGDAIPLKARRGGGAVGGVLPTVKQRKLAAREWLDQQAMAKWPRDYPGASWDYTRFPDGPGRNWKPGDPIDMPTPSGYPTYKDDGRERYWRNRAHFELEARKDGRATPRVVKLPGEKGHTLDDNLRWDAIEAASDDRLRVMLKDGKAPDDPMLAHLKPQARKVNIEHEHTPQRVAGWLEAVGVPKNEAARLTRASSPDNMMAATRDIHGAWDQFASSKRGGSGLFDAERASSPLNSASKEEVEAIIAAVKGRDLASTDKGRRLRDAIERAIWKFDQLRTPVKDRVGFIPRPSYEPSPFD